MATWTTARLEPADRYDAWCSQLMDSDLPWSPCTQSNQGFSAQYQSSSVGGMYMLQSRLSPFSASRAKRQIASSHEPYFSLQLLLEGSEEISHAGTDTILKPGSLFLTDSEQPMDFRVKEEMEVVSLRIPKRLIRPYQTHTLPATHCVFGSSGVGSIMSKFLLSLNEEIPNLNRLEQNYLETSAVSLLLATFFRPAGVKKVKSYSGTLDRIKLQIVGSLTDPELTPSKAADQAGISLRHLHNLFAQNGETFGRYVQKKRVDRAVEELRTGQFDGTITECAFKWGFSSSSHFSRVFKKLHGCSPREFMTEQKTKLR